MPSENDTEETRDENDKEPLNPSTPPSSRNLSVLDNESPFSPTTTGSRRLTYPVSSIVTDNYLRTLSASFNGCEVETPKDIELIGRVPP